MKKFFLLVLMAISSLAYAKPEVITLTPANVIVLRDEVSDDSVSKLSLLLEDKQGQSVYLYLYSPGGSIVAGMKLINLIKALSQTGTNITCIADYAASMAFSILQACPKRLAVENALIMQHQGSYTINGQMNNNREQVKLIEEMFAKLNEMDAARMGLSLSEFKARVDDDWWMFDDAAVKNKAADEMVLVKCDKALSKMAYVEVIESLFGTATVKWSACPLISAPLSIEMLPSKDAKFEEYRQWIQSLPLETTWKERKEVRSR